MKSSLTSEKISYEDFQLYLRLYKQYLPTKIEDLRSSVLRRFLKFSRADENLEMPFLRRLKFRH